MSAIEAKSFMVVSPHGYWGCGSTLAEAISNARKQRTSSLPRKSHEATAYAFECERKEIQIEAGVDLNFFWPAGKVGVKFKVKL